LTSEEAFETLAIVLARIEARLDAQEAARKAEETKP
jgi:hypothetical protein